MAKPLGVKLIPIKPKVFPQLAGRVDAKLRALYPKAAAELVKDHEKTTATWDTRVKFTVRISREAITVYTSNAIWRYVDQGTRPHIIRPRRARRLAFSEGYTAKTRVGSIIAGAGGPSGSRVFAREVQHPGTKARGFSSRLRSKWAKKFPAMVQQAIREAVRG
jgi:hypothetical protein